MYAPVIIPTLNRYEHLVRCVESLKRSPIAKQTELYISLDYPPAEKYREGYERVKAYLENELTDGFKNIYKYYQQENLGVDGNADFLLEQVYKVHDRYIFTEDDNEFSPNFLDYLNKGLDMFENDEEVFAICGYRNEQPWQFGKGNVLKLCLFHAWGFATWKKKDEACRRWICRDNFVRILHDKKACDLLYRTRKKIYYTFIEALFAKPFDYSSVYINHSGEIAVIDYTIAVYMIIFSKYCILPEVSMVRNWGFDGSGVNCRRMDSVRPDETSIDDKLFFEYCVPEVFEVNDANKRLNEDPDYKGLARRAKCFKVLMCTVGIPVARKIYNMIYIINSCVKKVLGNTRRGKPC